MIECTTAGFSRGSRLPNWTSPTMSASMRMLLRGAPATVVSRPTYKTRFSFCDERVWDVKSSAYPSAIAEDDEAFGRFLHGRFCHGVRYVLVRSASLGIMCLYDYLSGEAEEEIQG